MKGKKELAAAVPASSANQAGEGQRGKAPGPSAAPVRVSKPKKAVSLQKQKARMGWLFISPFLIGFVLIYLPMIFESIRYSFSETTLLGSSGIKLDFVGWKNFGDALFVDTGFVPALIGSIKSLIFNIPAIIIFSLFMAVLLNQKMRGRAIFRAIFFIPVIVSTGIIESIDIQNFIAQNQDAITGGGTGDLNNVMNAGSGLISSLDISRFFGNMAVGEGLVTYVADIVNNVYDIVSKSGVQMLIFLAGLQSISPSIYESCHIDGASAWETFWKITFPMISPMILVNAIYTVIDSFTSQSNEVMKYISNIYSSAGGNVKATAMSWIYFLLVIVILAAVGGIVSAFVFYQRKDT